MRRRRYGELLDTIGSRATASTKPPDPAKTLAHREHVEKAKAISKAGGNKGEQRGFGATAAPVADPIPQALLDMEKPPSAPAPFSGTCANLECLKALGPEAIVDEDGTGWCDGECLDAYTEALRED